MFLARVTHAVVSVQKHPAYRGKIVFVVQPIRPDGQDEGHEWVAVDYVGAGIGDIVVCGGAPGVARKVFNIDLAPMRTLIMAIVDSLAFHDLESNNS
jgi:ethanolamine utilization protein EutN